MGGPGSGRHAGPRGRLAGVGNTRTHTEALRAGMLAMYALRASAPETCEECGRGGSLVLFRQRWLCEGSCLNDAMEPLRIEDFVYTGGSNLGDAAEYHGMQSDHGHGPTGDQAISTPATRAAATRRRARRAE